MKQERENNKEFHLIKNPKIEAGVGIITLSGSLITLAEGFQPGENDALVALGGFLFAAALGLLADSRETRK